MKVVSLLLTILAFSFVLNASPKQTTEITATTEAPTIYEKRTLLSGLLSEADYRKTTAQLSKLSYFPSIKRKPSNLTANAGFGFNLNFGGLNRSWIVDDDAANGYLLYADLNGNGDLSDDPPLKFENADGKYFLIYKTVATEGQETYPYQVKIELTSDTAREQSSAKLSLAFYNSTVRQGKINLGNGREINFELIGTGGFYNAQINHVVFDLNGDGQFDAETEKSIERYSSVERYVNLAGATYEYEVDRYGRELRLKRLAETLPARESLLAGNIAPDFSFVDTTGTRRRLSDYRGKVVLLDFWGSWCAACRVEAPKLVSTYERLSEKGFEIIGINNDSVEADFKNFITQYKMSWTQTREKFEEGYLQKLYRANAFPTYYLIGKDGTILANHIESKNLIIEVEKNLDK